MQSILEEVQIFVTMSNKCIALYGERRKSCHVDPRIRGTHSSMLRVICCDGTCQMSITRFAAGDRGSTSTLQ